MLDQHINTADATGRLLFNMLVAIDAITGSKFSVLSSCNLAEKEYSKAQTLALKPTSMQQSSIKMEGKNVNSPQSNYHKYSSLFLALLPLLPDLLRMNEVPEYGPLHYATNLPGVMTILVVSATLLFLSI